jgi:hypothetical protein
VASSTAEVGSGCLSPSVLMVNFKAVLELTLLRNLTSYLSIKDGLAD